MPHRLFSAPQRDGLGKSEATSRQEGRIFARRALPPANVNEQFQVGVKNRQRLAGILGEVSLDEDEARTVHHRTTANREDGNRLIVLPVMDDVTQDVGVAAFGHYFEEASADELAAVGHTCVVDELPSVLDDVG